MLANTDMGHYTCMRTSYDPNDVNVRKDRR